MKMDINNLKCCIPEMKKKTNIKYIQTLIVEKFAKKYEKLLATDIEMKYKDIIFTINRFAKEKQHSISELIDMSQSSIKVMEDKVETQKKKYKDVRTCMEQLDTLITVIEKNTKKRLDAILSQLKTIKNSEG